MAEPSIRKAFDQISDLGRHSVILAAKGAGAVAGGLIAIVSATVGLVVTVLLFAFAAAVLALCAVLGLPARAIRASAVRLDRRGRSGQGVTGGPRSVPEDLH